jgi:hypothetical protein
MLNFTLNPSFLEITLKGLITLKSLNILNISKLTPGILIETTYIKIKLVYKM